MQQQADWWGSDLGTDPHLAVLVEELDVEAGRDAGHFALDTKADEIAALVREFMAQK